MLKIYLVFIGIPGITVLRDGHAVSRIADWIMYSVEAEFIDRVVAEYGPCKSQVLICFSPQKLISKFSN